MYWKVAVSACLCVSQVRRQINSALIVLKKVSTAMTVSEAILQLPLELLWGITRISTLLAPVLPSASWPCQHALASRRATCGLWNIARTSDHFRGAWMLHGRNRNQCKPLELHGKMLCGVATQERHPLGALHRPKYLIYCYKSLSREQDFRNSCRCMKAIGQAPKSLAA